MTALQTPGRGAEEIIAALERIPEVLAIHTANGRVDLKCCLGTLSLASWIRSNRACAVLLAAIPFLPHDLSGWLSELSRCCLGGEQRFDLF